ncbi:MAG: cysteine hydrolase family protein [Sphaerospermopsis kisseleviana]|jgi:nicotinamidase-related amidase|uniref:Isochorismatase hydrolase n=3 Tax=Sphaerospermopsis TaxID=752201 RepID=A0A480A2B9_9CYAN|nr:MULTISPECIES: cysteine hydrolase family protein [Sphaerospermopsis]BAZ79718.1 isochorismatase hydrolase [Sphaerospermopsis kisseleviana NIES-73]MBD2132429.1 cysteine hydrolase family protein [Sphaerospermopsis sp. FACHB-1094]MBD2145254.1 cysteine hydrolase family protein [Sphaerospermopsis sp. FACHB-1194]MBE9238879.1 cysteine hydrolase family protein [Sphaerospermopsis aphanizomenoides LEGE 00250]MDB9442838.1 cysteine hydrolase family protein [Sphaerospermopsis kisseleviana CS-549]
MNLPLRTLGFYPNAWEVNESFADITRPQKTPQPVILTTETKTVRIDLAKTAIIIIDMQNDFCHPDGWLAHIGVDVTPARQPIVPLQNLLPQLRAVNVPIIWLNWGNRPDLLNISAGLLHVYNPTGEGVGLGDSLPKNGAKVLMKDSWAAAVVEELEQLETDICIDKYRMSGFWDTSLDSILRNLGITTILFAGVNADQCVLTTLCDANFLGYDCILVQDCTATTSPEYCWLATLYNVKQCFGFVTDSSAIIAGVSSQHNFRF